MRVFRKRATRPNFNLQPSTFNRCRAFTLIELLVVISIMGLLASLAVPALKNLGKANAQTGAARQMLDDIGHARQLAISQHTTVYMVFVTTNFWGVLTGTNLNAAAYNLVDKQLTGYTFVSLHSVGDQPGRNVAHYLASWQTLPDGTYIAPQKFALSGTSPFPIQQWQNLYGRPAITNFNRFQVPFPTENSPVVYLPCLAFDYRGSLVSEAGSNTGADIPLVQGSVSYGVDGATKTNTFTPAVITETPAGNSGINNNSLSYNVIHIDAFTGRARSEQYKMP